MKIAVAQTFMSASPAENSERIQAALRDASEEGADLVLFCEGALSGYAKAQFTSARDWLSYDWSQLEAELETISRQCAHLGIFAVVGSAHRFSEQKHPHNSLHVISDKGEITGRYDKRYLSNSEVNDWYTPGNRPLTFDVDGFRFGCAICIEPPFRRSSPNMSSSAWMPCCSRPTEFHRSSNSR